MVRSEDDGLAVETLSAFRPLSADQMALLEASPAPTLVLDRAFRIRYVSAAAAAYGKVDRQTLIGRNVWECFPYLRGSVFERAYTKVLESGKAERFERYDEDNDRWQSVFAYPGDDGVVAMLEDITEQKRAQRTVEQSEMALAHAQEVARIGSFTVVLPHENVAGETRLSTQAYRLLGLNSGDTVSMKTVRSFIRDEDITRWLTLIAESPRGLDAVMDFAVRRADGVNVMLQVRSRVVHGPDGAPRQVFGTAQDVTSQREALETVRRSEQMLRLAQEAANIGSFERELRTGRVMWSEQLLRIVGLDPKAVGASWRNNVPRVNYVHPDDRRLVRDTLQRATDTGVKQTTRNRIIRHDGTLRYLESSVMLVRDANGLPSRLVGTVMDITEQVLAEGEKQRVEAQIQQAQKLESLGVLAGGIAHDFNNLLVGILGNASLALLDVEQDHEARQSIMAIEHSAQRAAELTRQLLAYAGKGRYVVEKVDATAAINDMVTLMRTALARNASLQLDLATALPMVDVDLNQFRQVVMNLVTNASDALNNQPGSVSIRTGEQMVDDEFLSHCVAGTSAAPGQYVFVEVRDTGTGMDEETRRRIFEPFFSTKFTGRGLGLAATIGIVRSHHGTIRVYSETGAGTAIRLLLPATSAPRAATPPFTAAIPPRSAGHILVVDDEESVRTVATALLRRRGFEVTEASSGASALEMFRAMPHAFSLVLLDLTMPGMDGDATFRALRDVRGDVNVLLMSGYNEQDISQLFRGRGLSGFLQKPFRADELFERVSASML